ncbi:MAG TPA: hypothetical protein VHO47_04695 [Candidatus Babeliales bacterium]|nr:hypothetical protein [Candidatus Babeliales bacterium]
MIKKMLLITIFSGAHLALSVNPDKPASNDPDIEVLEMVAQGSLIIKKSYEPDALHVNANLEATLWRLGKVFACIKAGRADVPTFYKMGAPLLLNRAIR